MERIFEMTLDDANDGVFAVSLVDFPAIEEDFVYLSKNKSLTTIKLKKTDEDKRLVSGAILIPNQKIVRMDAEGEYFIYFTADTIEKIAQNYLINHNQDKVTIQHEQPVNKVHMVESWIVGKNDKSKDLGFDLPEGTWFGTFKVDDDKIWDDFIKTEELRGFSIEGTFNPVPVSKEAKKELSMSLDDILHAAQHLLKKKIYLADLDDQYTWFRTYQDSCPSCIIFNGQTKSLRDWTYKALPRTKQGGLFTELNVRAQYQNAYGPYGTYCESHCRCKLIKKNKIKGKKSMKTVDTEEILFYIEIKVGQTLYKGTRSGSIRIAPKGEYVTPRYKITVGEKGKITKVGKPDNDKK